MTDKMRECFGMYYAVEFDECDVFTQKSWEAAWTASRESMVIEWPDQHTYTVPDCAGAAILDCRTAFSKAVKVKP